jgi:DNA-directed RNA polymerase subunit omega
LMHDGCRLAQALLACAAQVPAGVIMARVTVEDCLAHEENRFALCILASRRTRQLNRGVPALVESRNRAAVTALREIAATRVKYSRQVTKLVQEYIVDTKALMEAQDG